MQRPSLFAICGAVLASVWALPLVWQTVDLDAPGSSLWFVGGDSGPVVVALVVASRRAARVRAALLAGLPYAYVAGLAWLASRLWLHRANDVVRGSGYDTAAVGGEEGGGFLSTADGIDAYLQLEWQLGEDQSFARLGVAGVVLAMAAAGVLARAALRTPTRSVRRLATLAVVVLTAAVVVVIEPSPVFAVLSVAWAVWAMVRSRPRAADRVAIPV